MRMIAQGGPWLDAGSAPVDRWARQTAVMPSLDPELAAIIAALGLKPIPKGGHYRQRWKDEAGTAIYFLLAAGERSSWHRVHDRAEIWHFYAGAPVALDISVDGMMSVIGSSRDRPRPMASAPRRWSRASAWQTATSEGAWSLVGCTVSPPFAFDHFELAPPGWTPSGPVRGDPRAPDRG